MKRKIMMLLASLILLTSFSGFAQRKGGYHSGHYKSGRGSSHKGGSYKNTSTNNHYRKRH
jgi:hypothetical protein